MALAEQRAGILTQMRSPWIAVSGRVRTDIDLFLEHDAHTNEECVQRSFFSCRPKYVASDRWPQRQHRPYR